MRAQLSNGTVISLLGKEYRILNVIGDGASCIVYDVCSTNQFGITQRYRLKECYSYHAQCHREGLQLIWDDEAQRQSAFKRFTHSARLIADLRNEESIGNHITGTELIEGNGTLYALMEVNHAQTYQHDQTQDLHRILQTMLKLTHIVRQLHNQGYLHLDIKPENFLVSYDPEPNIWLFDVDSLVAQEELHSGRTTCYSYSREWAAPELTQGKISKICFATDLFSIGAILFNKVMGRPVCNDDIGLFPDWDFDGKLFEDVNPKIKLILQSIFEKTLSAAVRCRYQRANELCDALEKACEITADSPFIQTDLPCLTNDFIGREYEVSKIEEALQAGNTVFLHGFGGIGKSSLAVAYAHQHIKQYVPILFLRYQDSLKDLLLEIDIQHFDGSDKEKIRLLKRLLDKDTLLIVDNFDIAVDEDDYLDEFLRLPAKKIFTTRTNFASVYGGQIHQIEIAPLPLHQLIQLFSKSSKFPAEVLISNPTTQKLLKAMGHQTLGTILAGRQMAMSGWSIEEMYEQYTNGFYTLSEAEDIKILKDGRTRRATIPDHIRVLFNLASLTNKHKDVLCNVYILNRVVKVSKDSYRKFITYVAIENREYDQDEECWRYSFTTEPNNRAADINALNDLEELGWVDFDGVFYSLHPMVEELVVSDLVSDEEKCPEFYRYIRMMMESTINPYERDEVDEELTEQRQEFLCHYFFRCDYRIPSNLCFCIEWMTEMSAYNTPHAYPFARVYNKLEVLLSKPYITLLNECHLRYILFSANLAMLRYNSLDSEEIKQKHTAVVGQNFDEVKQAAKKLTVAEQKTFRVKLYTSINNLINDRFSHGLSEEFVKQVLEECPEIIELTTEAKQKYNIPLSDDEQEQIDAKRRELESDPEYQYYRDIEEYKNELRVEFLGANDKRSFIQSIIDDPERSEHWKMEDIGWCTGFLFNNLSLFHHFDSAFFEGIGWPVIWDILKLEREYLNSLDDYRNWSDWGHNYQENMLNHLVTGAALADTGLFDQYMVELNQMLTKTYQERCHWSCIVRDISGRSLFARLVDTLCVMGKVSYVFPHFLDMSEQLESYAKSFPDYKERYMYQLYQKIVYCASAAAREKHLSKELSREYRKIEDQYQEKLEAFIPQDYILNFDSADE